MENEKKNSPKDPTVKNAIQMAVILIVIIVMLFFVGIFVQPLINPAKTFTPLPIATETFPLTPTATDIFTLTSTSTETSTPLPIATETFALTPTVTETSTPAPTDTQIYANMPFTPIVGTIVINSPTTRFGIESWDNDSAECSSKVIIYGVIISHGTQPYTFMFWTQKEPYIPQPAEVKQIATLENFREYVEFVPPIVVVKGKYKHVELTFQSADGKQVTWIDDLFYPIPNSTCH